MPTNQQWRGHPQYKGFNPNFHYPSNAVELISDRYYKLAGNHLDLESKIVISTVIQQATCLDDIYAAHDRGEIRPNERDAILWIVSGG